MGYYTSYSLKVNDDKNEEVIIAELRNVCESAKYALDEAGGSYDSCKWYEHASDMARFSLKYPKLLFTLYGEGEESGDLWIKYFMNGKCMKADAVITYEPFDKTKLRDVSAT